MKIKNLKISVIIVNYNVGDKLINCINSILTSKLKTKIEIIVVENGKEDLGKKLNKISSQIKYIKSTKNLGYGGGINLGSKYASGNYIFILNPDTFVEKDTIDKLYQFLKSKNRAGAVSPLLLGKNLKPFETQSKKELTPINSILSFSVLRKLFPSKSIYNDKFFKTWNKEFPIEVKALPGAAIMISKKLFNKLNGFDESFFLYFEENDLSKRIINLGLKLYVIPDAKVIHEVGQSTKELGSRQEIFEKSRFYYLKKHYGLIQALTAESINRFNISLMLIVITAFILRIYNIFNGMSFIGDFAWFYLSARDFVLNGKVPLVGITSSHTWLHQGPLWTYVLSLFLPLFKFSPFTGAYITIVIGTISTYLIYKVTKELFSKKAGLIASLLYATSPLVIFSDRVPYHTSPIPFLVILYFYFLSKWVKGDIRSFPLVILAIIVLYNFELATFSLFFPFLLLVIYGACKKRDWVINLLNKKYLTFSFLAFVIPMFPILIYDLNNGFKQTLVFFGWTIYKPISSIFNFNFSLSSGNVLNFLSTNLSKLIFSSSVFIAGTVFLLSLIFLFKQIYFYKKNKIENSKFLLLFLNLTVFLAIIINKTPSDAYLPMTFPLVIISISIFFDYFSSYKNTKFIFYSILIFVIFSNAYISINNDRENQFKKLQETTTQILDKADGKSYNLIGKGPGSQFESFTMNYQYLLWLNGNEPLKKNTNLKFLVNSDENTIEILNK